MTGPDTVDRSPVRMSTVDTVWLGMDSPDNLMMVTAVLQLDEPVDRERLIDVLRHRLLARYPTFSQRPLPARTPFEQPSWVTDPAFDLDRHVVDAGPLDDDAGLAGLVSDLLSRPLDMRHSPWQFHVAEIRGHGTAVVARLHHCIADGIALANVLLSLTDDRPGVPAEEVAEVVTTNVRDPLRPRSLSQAIKTAGFGWRVLTTGLGLLFATRDPRTRLHGRLGARKGAAWTEQLDLGQVKAVASAFGATVNDVLLAVTAGALRRHLRAHGDRVHDLRVFVPVDLRPRDEPVPATLGNRFGIVFVQLPVAEADPVARVRAVHARMRRVKARAQAASTFAILAAVGALPVWGHRLAVRILGAKCTAIVTNVPGPRRPVFLAGARLERLVFWVPQAGSVGLGVSILSYSGRVTVGVAADRNVVPDPAQLTAAVEAELAHLAVTVLGDALVMTEEPIDSERAQALVAEVQQEYVRRYGGQDATAVDGSEFARPYGTFLVASVAGEAVGCAGLRRRGDGVAEIKRMFVRPAHRRRGHARAMLAAVERWARERGYRRVVLETGTAQPEAIAVYTAAGYAPTEGFGHYKDSPLSRSFARDL